MEKIIIIGGGPIGLFAASELEKKKIDYLLLEATEYLGGQITNLYPEKEIVDIPNINSIKAKDFIKQELASINPGHIKLSESVLSIEQKQGYVEIKTKTSVFMAENVIIATGLGEYKARTMGLENEDKYDNILYSLKDFSFLKNKSVAIFGGGDSALDWAKEISAISNNVNLIHRRTEFRGNPETIKGRPVNLFLPFIPKQLIIENNKCIGIEIEEVNTKETKNLMVDFILVNYGSVPSPSLFNLPKGTGFGILVNDKMSAATNIYAVGDCASYEGKIKRIAPGMNDVKIALETIMNA